MLTTNFVLLSVTFVALLKIATALDNPTVNTWNGIVRGRKALTENLQKPYYVFQGIPYAEPPIGPLRFQPPRPKQQWQGILNTTEDAAMCIQGSPPVGSEDCLFINVYTPKLLQDDPLVPVMVFIYGGGFQNGDSTYQQYGPDHLLEQDVSVVTFNYRVGILGFLSTGDDTVPGNMGFKDQLLALKWVQDNIGRFGGDRDKVTIFGQSAGSASISYLMQTPLSKGLFHRAILHSGVSLGTWALSRHVLDNVKAAATVLRIDTSTSESIVAGLKSVDVVALQDAAAQASLQNLLSYGLTTGFAFGPVIEPSHEGAVITKRSHEALSDKDFVKVPCIIGFNSMEGSFGLGEAIQLVLRIFDLNPLLLAPPGMNINDNAVQATVASLIKEKYFGDALIHQSEPEAIQYMSDDQFNRPIREFVRLIHKDAPVYFYRFSFEGGLWGVTERPIPGVRHSEELGYLFRSPHEATEQDLITRERMVALWTNFAKFGNPTPAKRQPVLEHIQWDPSDDALTHIDIGNTLVKGTHPEKVNMEFWDEIFDTYGVRPYDTY